MNKRLALPLALVLAAACQTVPITGRSQFNFYSVDEEIQLGFQAYSEATSDAHLVTSGPEYDMVQRVGRKLAETVTSYYPDPAGKFEWEFKLIDDPETMNAWVLPGGKAAVYTGIFRATVDENGLAVVLGHEAAHALARHGGERMSQTAITQLGLSTADIALGDMSAAGREAIMTGLALGSQVGFLMPYSRTHESEADEIGLYIAATSGYDPRAAIAVWERMAEMGGGAPPEFLSTHPNPETRIQDFQAIMPIAMNYYKAALRKSGRPMPVEN